MEIALVLARMAAGGYFVWSASTKLGKTQKFWSEIMGYKLTGARTSGVLASVIIPVQFIAGLYFSAGISPFATGVALLALLLVFTAAMSVSLARKTGNNCGCGGKEEKVRPILIVRNAALSALVVGGMFSSTPTYPGEPVVLAAGAIVAAVIAVGSYRQLAR
ncbi:MauE/DoxX family redox-associated membrane protein [Microbacterium sp. NPDC076911]|uniref:MauE/DoxX family redox-associated membrane protein n=1 Tax=Microbacterium sp. NPDC076911 TaxID=3154958 RepID=UPI003448ED55